MVLASTDLEDAPTDKVQKASCTSAIQRFNNFKLHFFPRANIIQVRFERTRCETLIKSRYILRVFKLQRNRKLTIVLIY